MSKPQPEFDIWEFVSCAKCHLPFSADPTAPPLVPFWLTSCGHVLCNNHISSNQSCAICGEQRVQMVPLQREMDAPMSDWFGNVTYSLDASAHAIKFQLDTLASLVQYYKTKASQHRGIFEKLKSEHQELKAVKKEIEELRYENQRLRQYAGLNEGDPLDALNRNGKRSRIDAFSAGSHSSPRSVPTPLGPNRLTLPPNQQQPHLGQRQDHNGPQGQQSAGGYISEPDTRNRPGSSRYAQRYAYAPPQTPANDVSHSIQPGPAPPRARNPMPPPPTPLGGASRTQDRGHSRFDPGSHPSNQAGSSRHPQTANFPALSSMQPPPSRAQHQTAAPGAVAPRHPQSIFPAASSNNFAPSGFATSHRFMPDTPSGNSRRFLPPTVTHSASRSSRAPGTSGSSGTQRMQFGHGAQFG